MILFFFEKNLNCYQSNELNKILSIYYNYYADLFN